ncbi:MAG TPA: CoA transferase [Gammaproteobacteria bacterium]|nr:CoA transferase [Gammaproteobacteria bacterium]
MELNQVSGALAGLRVVDLSRVLGGPFCTQVLADHGAEVIKLEPPQGDETREWGPPFRDGLSAYYSGANRNKQVAAVDLRRPEGREIVFNLLEGADVLVHNFKSGAMERWGMGYDEVLRERFPQLIYCHVTGFGEHGPLGGLPGYDAVVQALSGTMSINGAPDGGPVRMGTPIVDLGTGLYAVIAILMALIERNRSGLGQKLDVSLYDCCISMLHPQAANTLMSGKTPQRTGNAHPNISPYDAYRTGKGMIFLGVGNNGQFAKLCQLLGNPALAQDPRFGSNGDRVVNREELKVELEALLVAHEADALSMTLLQEGVPAGAVLDVAAALEAPHTKFREMVVSIDNYKGTGIPIKLSRTPGSVRTAPRRLGQDSREVCRKAGLSEAQIDELIRAGVVIVSDEVSA